MPKVLICGNWIFVFYDTDIYENRMHVHIGKRDTLNLCKIWLEPDVEVSKNGDLTYAQLKEVIEIVIENRSFLTLQWTNFINGEKIKTLKK